jgi:hypothetical protein
MILTALRLPCFPCKSEYSSTMETHLVVSPSCGPIVYIKPNIAKSNLAPQFVLRFSHSDSGTSNQLFCEYFVKKKSLNITKSKWAK